MRTLGALLLLGIPVAATVADDGTVQAAARSGSFELPHVEDLGLYFAEESIRRLYIPATLRIVAFAFGDRISRGEELEKLRAAPPRANSKGVVYPFGKSNPLSLAYDAERKSMTTWERFIRYPGIGYYGFTGPELAAALNEITTPGQRAGGEFAFDPVERAVSLRREYLHPPRDKDAFYRETERLVKARLDWMDADGRFLETSRAAALSHAPPGSASGELNGFGATMALRHFSVPAARIKDFTDRYATAWERKQGARAPLLVSDRRVRTDQAVGAFIHFRGPGSAAGTATEVTATFRLTDPNGKPVFGDHRMPIWQGAAPPADHLQLGRNNLLGGFDQNSPLGEYRLDSTVCDKATRSCLDLFLTFDLVSGGRHNSSSHR